VAVGAELLKSPPLRAFLLVPSSSNRKSLRLYVVFDQLISLDLHLGHELSGRVFQSVKLLLVSLVVTALGHQVAPVDPRQEVALRELPSVESVRKISLFCVHFVLDVLQNMLYDLPVLHKLAPSVEHQWN
jgi:hypothetical protein